MKSKVREDLRNNPAFRDLMGEVVNEYQNSVEEVRTEIKRFLHECSEEDIEKIAKNITTKSTEERMWNRFINILESYSDPEEDNPKLEELKDET